MAKKQAERQQRAKEEAIASGMLKSKGSGKQRRESSDIDRGVVEDGGLFKAGMLRVKGTFADKASKKGSKPQRRAFSSGKIGNLDGNSQKPWNVARTQQKSKRKGSGHKARS